MTTLDIIILVPLAFGAYLGFKKGLLLEIIAILAFILAIIGGFKLMEEGVTFLSEYLDSYGQLLPFLSFIVIFLLIILFINMLGKILKKVIDMTLLGGLDRFAGAVLGILKWGFGISILLWLLFHFGIQLPGQDQEHVLYPFLVEVGPNLIDRLSSWLPFAKELISNIKDLISGV